LLALAPGMSKRSIHLLTPAILSLSALVGTAHAGDSDGRITVSRALDGSFAAGQQWGNDQTRCWEYETCLTGDFNGDGRQDLVAFAHPEMRVYVALNTGTGSFTGFRVWNFDFSPNGQIPKVGDVNGDGLDDIVTFTHDGTADVFVALSDGRDFLPYRKWHDSFPSVGVRHLDMGDFNGDGKDDLVGFANGQVHVALSNGRVFGTRTKWRDGFAPSPEQARVGDFNGDGKDDIAAFTQQRTADVWIALSEGNRFGAGSMWHDGFCQTWEVPMVGDVNGDGRDDILAVSPSFGHIYVAVSLGNQFWGHGWMWASSMVGQQDEFAVADVTGDGRADFIDLRSNEQLPPVD